MLHTLTSDITSVHSAEHIYSMLSSSKLTSRLLRISSNLNPPGARFAHEAVVSEAAQNDTPPPTPSPFSKGYAAELSGRGEVQNTGSKAKSGKRKRKTYTKSPFDTINQSTSARIEELRAQHNPEAADAEQKAHERISARFERVRAKKTTPKKVVQGSSSESLQGPQFWKMDWGEDSMSS